MEAASALVAADAAAPFVEMGIGGISSAKTIGESRSNRRFQRNMSNTAHQRAVKDLRKAGLNPILAAMKGGASTPGGSAATIANPAQGLSQNVSKIGRLKEEIKNLQANTNLSSAQALKAQQETKTGQALMNQILTQTKGTAFENVEKQLDATVIQELDNKDPKSTGGALRFLRFLRNSLFGK